MNSKFVDYIIFKNVHLYSSWEEKDIEDALEYVSKSCIDKYEDPNETLFQVLESLIILEKLKFRCTLKENDPLYQKLLDQIKIVKAKRDKYILEIVGDEILGKDCR